MNTAYPTLNFGLGEDIDMLRDQVYQFAQNEIAPLAEKQMPTISFQTSYGPSWATWVCLASQYLNNMVVQTWAILHIPLQWKKLVVPQRASVLATARTLTFV